MTEQQEARVRLLVEGRMEEYWEVLELECPEWPTDMLLSLGTALIRGTKNRREP